MKKRNGVSLADKIAGVLITTPASYDPEDDNFDHTSAKLTEYFPDDEDEELVSEFRKKNVDLLVDIDERYAGKAASRKSLNNSDDEDASASESQSEQDSDDNLQSDIEEEKDIDVDENDASNDSNADVIDESEEYDEADSEESEEESGEDDAEANFKHFNETDVSAHIEKGICARNQMKKWENLLEIRIQLQKCLIAANKMPQKNCYAEVKIQSGSEFSDQVAVTKNSLTNLLHKLLLLQKLCLSKYPETRKLDKVSTELQNDDDEIYSDTESEQSEDLGDDEKGVPKKKRKLNDIEKEIKDSHELYTSYRNSVIQKWDDKTRITSLKNINSSHSVLNHIQHTLSDKGRLKKKTQLKRSDYTILGQDTTISSNDKNGDARVTEEYNSEIFDDDDFYHQLLRELIEVKSADLTDPVQLGRQWIQLQKLRSKMKRKIDTKATKGRKIRYTVHTKLVNFMAPIDEELWTDQAKTDLFNSLFGKKEYSGSSESNSTTDMLKKP